MSLTGIVRSLGLAALVLATPALADTLRFRHFSQADGLPVNAVRTAFQDRDGFLWVGTHEGLARYDGYEFRSFRHDPRDPGSLSDNIVTRLAGDGADGLWVATLNGLNRFDAGRERFARVEHGHAGPDRVYALARDRAGALWVGCEQGLIRLAADGRVQPLPGAGVPAGEVRDLALGPDGALWVGQLGGGLHRVQTDTGAVQSWRAAPGGLPEDRVSALAVDGGRVLVGMRSAGLAELDLKTGAWSHFPAEPAKARALADGAVTSLFLDAERTLWLGTFEGGLHRRRAGETGFARFRHHPSLSQSLSHDTVRGIYQDRSGVLWVATREGLDKYDTYQERFRLYAHDPADAGSLSHNTVGALLESRDGALWVGTQPGGLNRVDPASGQARHYRAQAGDARSLSDDLIWSLHEDAAGRLWVGTGAGLNRYRPGTDDFERYRGEGAPVGAVHAVLSDRTGLVWLSTAEGLLRLDPETGRFKAWRAGSGPDGLSSDRVGQVAEDETGALWLAFDGELNRLDPGSGRVSRLRPKDPAEVGPNNEIGYLADDGAGGFWLTTSQGLKRFTRASGRFQAVEALPRVLLFGVLVDAQGAVWAPSNRGLYRYEPGTGRVRVYYGEDGLQGDEFNAGAYHAGRERLYFGGTGGVSAFAPGALADHPVKPPVALTELRLFNQPQAVGTRLLPAALNRLPGIALGYKDDVVSVGFAGLDLASPGRVRYRYRLEGLDERWIETGPEARWAQFTDLAPGDYVLHVQAANKHGLADEAGRRLAIHVGAPPWRTAPAYGAYALSLFGLGLAYTRRQRAKLLAKTAQAEALGRAVDARTGELKTRNAAIASLLDNAGQGFLAFGPELRVEAEYSAECARLLGPDLAERPVAALLHPGQPEAAAFLAGVLADWLACDQPERRALFHSLLPERIALRGRRLKLEWRDLGARCLAVLTDVSAQEELACQVELERNHLRRVLKAVLDPRGVQSCCAEYERFCRLGAGALLQCGEALRELMRAVHTFKGNFAQIEFEACRAGLHALEDRLLEAGEDRAALAAALEPGAMLGWLEEDRTVLEHYLGTDFLARQAGARLRPELAVLLAEAVRRQLPPQQAEAVLAELERLRTAPFAELLAGYPALVRDLAEAQGKTLAPLRIEGDECAVEVGRFEAFARSLVHVFRNQVDHGIEDAGSRHAAGKPACGELHCRLVDTGATVDLLLADDGAGIATEAVRAHAIEQGLLAPAEAAALPAAEAWMLIFADGLSTRADVSDLSGRGVGLAAVRAEVERLGGLVRVASIPGRGTSFLFSLPKQGGREEED